MKAKNSSLIPQEVIENKILLIRGHKVMLNKDLAALYGVKTKVLNQAVKRNISRFPDDFMFQLSKEEAKCLRSQIVTLKQGKHLKYMPFAFTEQGVAMLSSVINSERAIQVNIHIMRTFTKLRQILLTHKDIQAEIEKLHKKYSKHDADIQAIFSVIKQLIIEKQKPVKKMGFCRE